MNQKRKGPDGWRWAYVTWPSGNVHMSRRTHYFENGRSLCGAHNDISVGTYSTTLKDQPEEKYLRCKKCLKKVKKDE